MTVISEESAAAALEPAAPTVSVVLCTWNGERWLGPFLDSVAAQELLPDELVIQDDRSTDGTIELIEAFARTAPFAVRLEANDRQLGSTANFERALARAEGQIIALADQDDLWYPNKLSRLVGVLGEDPILTLAFSDADLLDASGSPSGRRLWNGRGIDHLLTKHEILPGPLFARRSLTTGCTMVARRRAVEAALPFPTSLEDPAAPMRHDRWLSMVAAAVGTVRAVPEPLLGFRVHPDQQTGVLSRAEFARRLAAAAAGAAGSHDPTLAVEHLARARQIDEAALRADRLGDFEEADELRRVADHHRSRADLGPTVAARVATVWSEATTHGYDHSALGAAAAAADLVRALRRRPARAPGAPGAPDAHRS